MEKLGLGQRRAAEWLPGRMSWRRMGDRNGQTVEGPERPVKRNAPTSWASGIASNILLNTHG